MRNPVLAIWLGASLVLTACHTTKPTAPHPGPTAVETPEARPEDAPVDAGFPAPVAEQDLDSKDILARTATTPEVHVKHVLIGWRDLAGGGAGDLDPRAAGRTNAEAAAIAQNVLAKLRANPELIDSLIREHSEDPGSLHGEPYKVRADSGMVSEFIQLALRLNLNESGIVRSMFGYHVMERVAPPTPDPLESADILARPANPGLVHVQHILLGWKDSAGTDPRGRARTKPEADKLAKEVLVKVRARGDMAKLMNELSEDPGSAKTAHPYEVTAESGLVEPFKNLALRLKVGEAGLVKTVFGWHIIKRIPPPLPDSLESAAILKRAPTTEKANVKHILLGWKDFHAEDPRGVARTRAALEKLVKQTVAKLKQGDKIEPLMKELSEDPGSAESGQGYEVTPESGLVAPFKNLSLRLKLEEVGVVKTEFGIHIIKRVE